MREVLTLQLGGFANYVGSHFWNFQDETLGLVEGGDEGQSPVTGLDMDVLYRVGETRQGLSTYTPRLLALDQRGSLGAVRAVGSLYEGPPQADLSSVTTWSGSTTTYRAEPYEKNEFLQSLDEEEESSYAGPGYSQGSVSGNGVDHSSNGDIRTQESRERARVESLENSVQFWTDYQKFHLHPQSVYELQNSWHGLTPFDSYGNGQGLLMQHSQIEEVQDRLRFFVEECDHLQGFQILVDDSGGFSGVAADFLEEVVEEYGQSPRLLFALRPPGIVPGPPSNRASVVSRLHESISLARLSSLTNLLVPLGIPHLASSQFARHLCMTDSKFFHSSAVYAAAVNTITLPFRMEVAGPVARGIGNTDMDNLVQLVSCSQAKKVALMQASLPGPAVPAAGSRDGLDLMSLASLTPGVDFSVIDAHVAEALVIQGARLTGSRGPASVSQVLESASRARTGFHRGGLSLCHLAVSPSPLPIPLPFPCIFGPRVGRWGDIMPDLVSHATGRGGLDVVSSPVAARVSTSEAILAYVKERAMNFSNFGLSRGSVGSGILEEWGFPREEAQDLSETLNGFVAAYGESTESVSSDSE